MAFPIVSNLSHIYTWAICAFLLSDYISNGGRWSAIGQVGRKEIDDWFREIVDTQWEDYWIIYVHVVGYWGKVVGI